MATGAGLGFAALIASANMVTVVACTHYAKRFGNLATNLRLMHKWVQNGKPEFQYNDKAHCYEMKPTVEDSK